MPSSGDSGAGRDTARAPRESPPGATALEVACARGDPMQQAVALMAQEASLRVSAVLGGGTQVAASIAGGATHEALLGSIEALADASDTQGKA